MKGQASIIVSILFALIIAIFAVINVDSVPVNFLFTTNEAPLILVILFSALMGSILTATFGFVRVYKLQREVKRLKQDNLERTNQNENELDENVDKTTDWEHHIDK